jgi:hypothetical protein
MTTIYEKTKKTKGGGTMARVTKEALERSINYLNKISKNEYRLESAYGGWKLVQLIPGESGVIEVTPGFVPRAQLLFTINAIIRYLELEERSKK